MSKLLYLSIQLYLLSKDERVRSDLAKLISIVKRIAVKAAQRLDTDKQEVLHSAYQRFGELKAILEIKMEEAVHRLYNKIHVAHTSDVRKMSDDLTKLTSEFNLLAARLIKLEQENK